MIIVNNHNGIKILKNLINDAKSSYPPFTLDSDSFNSNLKINRLLSNREHDKEPTIKKLIEKGMVNNLRGTRVNDIVMLSINDEKGTTEESFIDKQNDDYSLFLFLNLNQLKNIMSIEESEQYKQISEYLSLIKEQNKKNNTKLNRLTELNKELREEREGHNIKLINSISSGQSILKNEYIEISKKLLNHDAGRDVLETSEIETMSARRNDIKKQLTSNSLRNVSNVISTYST
jgi:hypothetical protein